MDTQKIYCALTRASDEQLIEELNHRGFIAIPHREDPGDVGFIFDRLSAELAYEQVAAPQRADHVTPSPPSLFGGVKGSSVK